MFYKLLGMLVWNGAKLVLRRKYGPTYVPAPVLAGRDRAGRASSASRCRAKRDSRLARRAAQRRLARRSRGSPPDASGTHPTRVAESLRLPRARGPRHRGRRVAAVGRRQRPRARARALGAPGGRSRAAGAAASRAGGGEQRFESLPDAASRATPRRGAAPTSCPAALVAPGRRRCGWSGPGGVRSGAAAARARARARRCRCARRAAGGRGAGRAAR